MIYGHEFGESTKLISENEKGFLNCKSWCLGDYLIGLEIEYSNINETTLTIFKDNLEKRFNKYEIKWTQL